MPWEVTGPVRERERFIEAHLAGFYTLTELAERFGIETAPAFVRLESGLTLCAFAYSLPCRTVLSPPCRSCSSKLKSSPQDY